MSEEKQVQQKSKSILQKAYDEGYTAYQSGKKLQDNPYGEGLVIYDQWEQGWMAAKGEDKS